MARCEHRYLADIFSDADIETDKSGSKSVKAGAKPSQKECQECGAKIDVKGAVA